ncbi:MAG: phage portal protein [Acidobacteriia bacterium]|nr:phage portal protein [Terriglobia bacterium]
MNIRESLRGALRRIAGVRALEKRRTQPLPSILSTYSPRSDALPKPTPANLRRFAETPIARKAINTIKDRIAGMRWRVQPRKGRAVEEVGRDASRPLVMWPVDGSTIRMKADWDGQPASPRYVQATGRYGPEGQIVLNDDELCYIRLNPRTHTPFGLGRLEVAFETINEFLGAHRYAARLASNSVVQYALWLQDLGPAQHERLIHWWQDEIEGTGRVPILSVESKPEVLRFGQGTDSDLRLAWQEFLLRVIADAFDLPPFFLGVEHDVNRSTAAELSDLAFRQAIVPTARLLAEHLTRDAIGKKLGWSDLEFVFTDVDARNEMEDAQIQEILLRSGVLTVNEVRRMRGLPPL